MDGANDETWFPKIWNPKGHIQDWELQLLWLAMGYRFSQQAFLSSFKPYFYCLAMSLNY
jgi:hypothetical protein